MKLKGLRIDGFGKFHNRSIDFSDGLNLIYGKNEAGKSTLHTFIKAMLFGLSKRPEAGRRSEYESFEPWNNGEIYGGSLELSFKGEDYRIVRSFANGADELRVIKLSTGESIIEPSEALKKITGGLTETGYKNTISIGQLKSATDKTMAKEFKAAVENLNKTGSAELSYDSAIAYLEKQREGFLSELDSDAAVNYSRRMGRIRNLERELSGPKYDNRLPVYTDLRDKMKERLVSLSEEKEKLVLKTEKAKATLFENGFTELASIDKYEEDCLSSYNEYETTGRALKRRLPKAAAVLGLSAGLLLLAAAAYLLYLILSSGSDFYSHTVYVLNSAYYTGKSAVIIAVAGLLLILLSALLFMARSRRKKALSSAEGALKEALTKHIGNGDISTEAIEAFKLRMEEFRRLRLAVSSSEEELSKLNEELLKLHENQDNCLEIIGNEEKLRTELEEKLTELNGLKAEAEELKRIIERNNILKENIEAVELAEDKLKRLSEGIRSSIGMYINKEASKLIKGITGGVYDSMDVGADMEIYMNTRTRMVPVERVSAGTMDQIYLALRLAAVKLLENGGEELPLIFDDSFALYDDERLKAALSFIAGGPADMGGRQMIVFTCHHREERILSAAGIGYKLTEM